MAAWHEVTAARSQMKIFNSQGHLAISKAMKKLRESAQYADYAPGQTPEGVPGIVSAAEPSDAGGMRMYYFYPEDFPEIYEAKQKAQEVAELAIRRLLSMVNS